MFEYEMESRTWNNRPQGELPGKMTLKPGSHL